MKNPEKAAALKNPENITGIKTFSKEALEFLGKRGDLVYPLHEETINEQILAGRPFRYYMVGARYLDLPSMKSQVAFNPSPDKFFLPHSGMLTLSQQQEMIAEYSSKLQREFRSGTIKAVMGDVQDYTSLVFAHLDSTGERLFDKKYTLDGINYRYARTKTRYLCSEFAVVGLFSGGLTVNREETDAKLSRVQAVPLIVPV